MLRLILKKWAVIYEDGRIICQKYSLNLFFSYLNWIHGILGQAGCITDWMLVLFRTFFDNALNTNLKPYFPVSIIIYWFRHVTQLNIF